MFDIVTYVVIGGLPIDVTWYLSNQILPPVARLCGPIEETNAGKIAHCLGKMTFVTSFRYILSRRVFKSKCLYVIILYFQIGLDPKQFHNFNSKEENAATVDDDDVVVAIDYDDEEKFKAANQLGIKCLRCQNTYNFPGVFYPPNQNPATTATPAVKVENATESTTDGITNPDTEMKENTSDVKPAAKPNATNAGVLVSGFKCPSPSCTECVSTQEDSTLMESQITNKLYSGIRESIMNYYSSSYKCSDSSCGRRSRDISIKGNKCLIANCKGRMEKEYPASKLYLQLAYYHSLFDMKRAKDNIRAENKRRTEDPSQALPQLDIESPHAIKAIHQELYTRLSNFMNTILSHSNYHYLPPSIFQTNITATSNNKSH